MQIASFSLALECYISHGIDQPISSAQPIQRTRSVASVQSGSISCGEMRACGDVATGARVQIRAARFQVFHYSLWRRLLLIKPFISNFLVNFCPLLLTTHESKVHVSRSLKCKIHSSVSHFRLVSFVHLHLHILDIVYNGPYYQNITLLSSRATG